MEARMTEKIMEATSFPPVLALMVSGYAVPPKPNKEEIAAVNENLSCLKALAPYLYSSDINIGPLCRLWDGVSVTINGWREQKSKCDLTNLDLNGIVFNQPGDEKPLSSKSVDEINDMLAQWNTFFDDLPYLYDSDSFHNRAGEIIFVDFRKTFLEKAKFENLFCTAFDFTEAKLTGASFEGSVVTDAIIKNADLRDAKFHRAIFQKGSMKDCQTEGATFEEATFDRTDLSGTDFKKATITGANLKGAIFDLTQFTQEQVELFRYPDPHAARYIKAIHQHMNKHPNEEDVKRGNSLILSFIHDTYEGENPTLTTFLKQRNTRIFASSPLRKHLLAVQLRIKTEPSPAPVDAYQAVECKGP